MGKILLFALLLLVVVTLPAGLPVRADSSPLELEPASLTLEVKDKAAQGRFKVTGAGEVKDLAFSTEGLKKVGQEQVAVGPGQITIEPAAMDMLAAAEALTVTVSIDQLPEAGDYEGQVTISYVGQTHDPKEAVGLSLTVEPQAEAGSPGLKMEPNELLFRAPTHWLPVFPFKFEAQKITLYAEGEETIPVSVSAPQLQPKDQDGQTLLRGGAKGYLDVYVCETDACNSIARLTPTTTVDVVPGTPKTLIVKPVKLGSTGVYTGSIQITERIEGTLLQSVQVEAVGTDGPVLALLLIALGVGLVAWLVYLQDKGKKQAKTQLRSASLYLRLSTLLANAWDQAFSGRLVDGVRDKLRDILYQSQAGVDVDEELTTIGETIDGLATTLASIGSAEETLQWAKDRFRLTGVPANRQIAGEAYLEKARIELGGADTESAAASLKAATEVFGMAFRRYRRLGFKLKEVQRAYNRHPKRFAPAWLRIEEASQWSDQRIDALEKTGDGFEPPDELERLDYWYGALGKVSDAIETVDEARAQKELGAWGSRKSPAEELLERALVLLGAATVENVKAPRTNAGDRTKDNLEQAEDLAAAAIKLCEASPWLAELGQWFPENGAYRPWQGYNEAWVQLDQAKEALDTLSAGDGGDAASAISLARQALVTHVRDELGRVAWRLEERWQEAWSKASRAVDLGEWEEGWQILQEPWVDPPVRKALAEQLLEQLGILEGCYTDEKAVLQAARASLLRGEATEAIRLARKAMSLVAVQRALVAHLRFEVRDLAGLDDNGLAALAGLSAAQLKIVKTTPHVPAVPGSLEMVMSKGPIQKSVAWALVEECALVTHHEGHPAWAKMGEARTVLEAAELLADDDSPLWARGLWKARWAWMACRQDLVAYYERDVQPVPRPGEVKCWSEAVRQARGVWVQAVKERAAVYVGMITDDLKNQLKTPGLEKEAKAAKVAEDTFTADPPQYATALANALNALAGVKLYEAEQKTKNQSGTPAYTAYQQSKAHYEDEHYPQAFEAAQAAIQAADRTPGPVDEGAVLADVVFADTVLMMQMAEAWQSALEQRVDSQIQKLPDVEERPHLMGWIEGLGLTLEQAQARMEEGKSDKAGALADKTDRMQRFLEERGDDLELAQKHVASLSDVQEAEESAATEEDPVARYLARAKAAYDRGDVEGIQKAGRCLTQAKLMILVREMQSQALQDVPEEWKDEIGEVLTVATEQQEKGWWESARASLVKAEKMLTFLKSRGNDVVDAKGRAALEEDPLGPHLPRAREAFARGETGDREGEAGWELTVALKESELWRAGIDINEVELRTRNQGLQLERATVSPDRCPSRAKPDLDRETSLDDLFSFEARLLESRAHPDWPAPNPVNYEFEWSIWEGAGNPEPVQPVQGRAKNQLVHKFDSQGPKGIRVKVTHLGVSTRNATVEKHFCVKPSRYQALLIAKRRKAIAEWAMVVAFASLIGLSTRYYAAGVESFGTTADYLEAFIYGAAAKTTQEIGKGLGDWFKALVGRTGTQEEG